MKVKPRKLDQAMAAIYGASTPRRMTTARYVTCPACNGVPRTMSVCPRCNGAGMLPEVK